MSNVRFTILIMQDRFSRYYTVDIVSRLIYWGCVPDSDEEQGFCKLNIMKWRRVICIFFCLQGCNFLIDYFILSPGSYLENKL